MTVLDRETWRRKTGCFCAGWREYEPTPAEIAAECKLIQAMWSREERRRRMRPDLRPVRWQFPVLATHALDGFHDDE